MSITFAISAARAVAGPWNIEPSVGVSTDYETNPGLHVTDVHSEEHVAGLLDFPLRYDTDGFEFMLRPSGRLSDSRGYDSLAANYLHLDMQAQITGDRSVTTLQGGLARDSSLYFLGQLSNGLGVRRDTESSGLDWTRTLTDRQTLQLDANWWDVKFDPLSSSTNLVDYRYTSVGPTWNFAETERTTLKILGAAGDYRSLNGLTDSKSYDLQAGAVTQLSEIWSLAATAGYSRAINGQSFYFGPFYLGTIKSTETGAVYSATLTRIGEQLNLSVAASRSLLPTGFAYLSRVDGITLNTTYMQSERWDFGLTVVWQKANNPILRGEAQNVSYVNGQLTANWHWTPQWMLTLNLGRISQTYGPPTVSAASNGAIFSITRRFLRTEL